MSARRPLISTKEGEEQMNAIANELYTLVSGALITESRAAEIMGWRITDIRAAERMHNSFSVADYARKVGVTRQTVIERINKGEIPGAFAVSRRSLKTFRIPKGTP